MAPVAIRRLVPADLPAYKDLRDEVIAAHPAAFTSDAAPERSPESYRSRLGLDRPEGGEFTLGAWQGERLVGAVSCERDPRAKVTHIGHVIGMMVRGDAQGHGIGRALLDACIEECRAAHGLVMLTLTVPPATARPCTCTSAPVSRVTVGWNAPSASMARTTPRTR